MQSYTVREPDTLLPYLFKILKDHKRTKVKKLLQSKSIAVNGKVTAQFDHPLSAGDVIQIHTQKKSHDLFKSEIKMVYEDEQIIVIDKPSGLLTVSNDKVRQNTAFYKVFEYVKQTSAHKQGRIFIVHRLDQDTSGLIVLAKNFTTKEIMQRDWKKAEKKYYAVVYGKPKEPVGEIKSYLKENKFLSVYSTQEKEKEDAKLAITRYSLIRSTAQYSLLDLHIKTGRKHQIRVHLSELGHPIVGDERYGRDRTKIQLALHAYYLAFPHPKTKRKVEFETKLPERLSNLMKFPSPSGRGNISNCLPRETIHPQADEFKPPVIPARPPKDVARFVRTDSAGFLANFWRESRT